MRIRVGCSSWGSLLALALVLVGCGSQCPEAGAPGQACRKGSIPAGRWTGEWQSYPLSNPDFVRSGTIEVVVSQSGTLTGHTAENDNPDTGSLSGTLRPTGELRADAVVSRGGQEKKYALSGSVACEGNGLAGAATVTWGTAERGNLKFRVQAVN